MVANENNAGLIPYIAAALRDRTAPGVILEVLYTEGPYSLNALSEKLERHKSSVSRNLGKLRDYGLLREEEIGHRKIYGLNEKGKQVAELAFGEG